MNELLDLVNEKDEVIGTIDRNDVDDSRHIIRTVYIVFYTHNKEIILQKRSLTKQHNPGKYTVSVSGHVESGWSYDDTAVKEALEETGVSITKESLTFIANERYESTMRRTYAMPFTGSIEDLKVEKGDGAGFKLLQVDDLVENTQNHPNDYTPYLFSESFAKIVSYIKQT